MRTKHWLSAALVALSLLGQPAHSQQQVVVVGGLPPSQMTSANVALTGSAQEITLNAASSDISMWTNSAAANMFFDPTDTTVSASNAIIYPGATFHYAGQPILKFKVLGANGTLNYLAK